MRRHSKICVGGHVDRFAAWAQKFVQASGPRQSPMNAQHRLFLLNPLTCSIAPHASCPQEIPGIYPDTPPCQPLSLCVSSLPEAFSLANDWGLTQDEAQAVIDRWFAAFPEISTWMNVQHSAANSAASDGSGDRAVATLLGRQRVLRKTTSFRERSRMRRVAGNTPVQGSAADLVLSAMLAVERSELLRQLGYQLILQIHDEAARGHKSLSFCAGSTFSEFRRLAFESQVILEGPEEHAEEALAELVRLSVW